MSGIEDSSPRDDYAEVNVGEAMLYCLKRAEVSAELVARLHVSDAEVQSPLRNTHRLGA